MPSNVMWFERRFTFPIIFPNLKMKCLSNYADVTANYSSINSFLIARNRRCTNDDDERRANTKKLKHASRRNIFHFA